MLTRSSERIIKPNSYIGLKSYVRHARHGSIVIAINLSIVFTNIANFPTNNHFQTSAPQLPLPLDDGIVV